MGVVSQGVALKQACSYPHTDTRSKSQICACDANECYLIITPICNAVGRTVDHSHHRTVGSCAPTVLGAEENRIMDATEHISRMQYKDVPIVHAFLVEDRQFHGRSGGTQTRSTQWITAVRSGPRQKPRSTGTRRDAEGPGVSNTCMR